MPGGGGRTAGAGPSSLFRKATHMAPIILGFVGFAAAAALVGLDLLVAVRAPARVRRLGRATLRGLHRKAESVVLGSAAAPAPAKGKQDPRLLVEKLISTRLGIWGLLATTGFLFFWFNGWVSP